MPSLKHHWFQWLPVLLLTARALPALDPKLAVAQYRHFAWTDAEGAGVPLVRSLAHGADGYLWVGTAKGLFRFDGMRFSRLDPSGGKLPDESIRRLLVGRRGELWIASSSGISRFENGRLRRYSGLDPGLASVVAVAEAPSDGIWVLINSRQGGAMVSSVGSLSENGSYRAYGRADGLPAVPVHDMLLRADGKSFELATEEGLCRWSPGSDAACTPSPGGVESLARNSLEELLVIDGGLHIRRVLHGSLSGPDLRLQSAIQRGVLLRDEGGNLWAGTDGGLVRYQAGKLERFTRRDGLSGNLVGAVIEDREGDLWVGTDTGIDRFQDPKALHFSTLNGLSSDATTAIAAARDGAIWVATGDRGLNRIRGTAISTYTWPGRGPLGSSVMSLYEDASGTLWAGTRRGLVHLVNGRFVEVPASHGQHLEWVDAIDGDQGGAVWVADERLGLLRVRGSVAEPAATGGIPSLFRVQAGRDGTLWAGSYRDGAVAIGAGGSSRLRLHEGPAHAIYEDRAGRIWIAMGASLSRFRHGKWTTWATAEGLPNGFIFGLAEDDLGSLWALSTDAVLRLPMAELDSAPDGSPRPLHFAAYGAEDGLQLVSLGVPSPRIVKAADGHIWLCERNGVAVLDPAVLHPDPIPPPVAIEQLMLNGKPLNRAAPVSFRAGELHVAYNGISLMAPERVRFRYRLEPKGEWIDAGTRRDVTYASLSPGRYRFVVAACNLDGVWNEAGAALDFRVEPFFYQTLWFYALCLTAVGLGIFGWHEARLRQLTSRFRLVAQERARVTREIHDSLLQGFAGVIYQLDAAWRQFDTNPRQSKEKLESALDSADEAMREARQLLSTMRLPALETNTLPEALAQTGAKLTAGTPVAFQTKVKGQVEPLPYDAQANLFLIGREAISNAVNHAGASRVTAQLFYTDKEFRLVVQDDGQGFDFATASDKGGHWGLRAMQERAKALGAEFRIETGAGRGTRIEVKMKRKKWAGPRP